MAITSAWTITASAGTPRAVYTDFPLGHTAGPPDDPTVQIDITRSALHALTTIDAPGTIIPLEHRWPSEWRTEARTLEDHRSERSDTPQYQSEMDRQAAIANHGEEAACRACTPS